MPPIGKGKSNDGSKSAPNAMALADVVICSLSTRVSPFLTITHAGIGVTIHDPVCWLAPLTRRGETIR